MMEREIVDWFIINKTISLFSTMLESRSIDDSIKSFIQTHLKEIERSKNILKQTMKMVKIPDVPEDLKCVFSELDLFAKNHKLYPKVLLLPLLMKDHYYYLDDVLKLVDDVEDKKEIRFWFDIIKNVVSGLYHVDNN